ncbi:Asparagine synthetase [Nitrospira sp. KM1]|uniref:asparagine synthase (glutamine-hydrolyzing) n=1 Tax=Nitrospira sp. KM1 TaxID=1936990 RepID=UPI0013A78FCF|nr:asparagine synthase (glutamine-hydrolyzing) [Nitrospira sp. KM1]BCA54221.1 Asparagine synthetase [Nitrospira sp. KM1]
MCGIAGRFGPGPNKILGEMIRTLLHRGPDDEHIVEKKTFALAARRLSILDVQGGRQPVSNERGTIWAAQNGEIYNFLELRAGLSERGHQLHTHCDTEVLPHLYEEYGDQLSTKIDGMFAVAVWDDEHHVGLLARDRMGKKPLYYCRHRGALYFASEIKALLCMPGFERKVCFDALHHFLSFKHVPAPLSIFEGIYILPPACTLTYRPGNDPVLRRYWDLDFSGADNGVIMSEEDMTDHVLELLRDGVRRRLLSDVPIGFFLSGGIDSSLSTVLAAELSGTRIKTFTLTYAQQSTTEGKEEDRRWARWVAERYETDHYEETIEVTNFPDNLRRIITCFDEPYAGVVSTYFLSQLISRHVKVALSGDGADELFGSYLSHRLAGPLANYQGYKKTGDAALLKPFETQLSFLEKLAEPDDWAWRYKLLVLSDEEKRALYSPETMLRTGETSTRALLNRYFSSLSAKDPLNRMLEAEFHTIFPDQVLAFVDRLSMAHSLEVRSAFLDTELVSFVAGLPGEWKIRNGETKYLLKKLALRYFPSEMVHRKKEGFLMPITQWLLRDLETYVRDTLAPQRLGKHGLFQTQQVQNLVDDLYRQPSDHQAVNRVYSLLVFQEWYDLYMA